MKKMLIGRLSGLFFGKVIFLLATLLCFACSVQAGIYDNFGGTTIDLSKWDVFINSGRMMVYSTPVQPATTPRLFKQNFL